MPRPLRLDFPGALFHIHARGVNRATIFIDDSDRIAFLKILDTACERYGGTCLAYCLMGNHYHLLLQTVEGRIGSLMQHLNGSYGRWFNRRRDRSGHLFQGRYGSSLIDSDGYLLEAARYVELNPCRAGLVEHPLDWEWSSARSRMGAADKAHCLDVEIVLRRFSPDTQEARSRYLKFVVEGLSEPQIADRFLQGTIVGSTDFIRKQAERARQESGTQQLPKHQRVAGRPGLDEILAPDAEAATRRRQARAAFLEHGYTMTAIARALGVHYTTISRWVKRRECDDA